MAVDTVVVPKEDATLQQFTEAANKHDDVDAFLDGDMGILHGRAGTTPLGTLDFEVLPEREYVIVCTFQDTPKLAPHFALGMVASMVSTK